MSGTVARVTEISAKSDTSFEDAAKAGLARANETLRGVKSAWIKEQSVDVWMWRTGRLLPTASTCWSRSSSINGMVGAAAASAFAPYP